MRESLDIERLRASEHGTQAARQRLAEEMAVMHELPERRIESAKRERVRVDSGSLIYVDRNTYSVPSRLIGEQVETRLTIDRLEVWYGQRKIVEMPRLRGRRKHRVDYRHILDWLVRKPGAFENYRYRDELFPTSRFRMAFDVLEEQCGSRAHNEYLRILEVAGKESESRVDQALRTLLNRLRKRSLLSGSRRCCMWTITPACAMSRWPRLIFVPSIGCASAAR